VEIVDSMCPSAILQKFPHFRISAMRRYFGRPITPLSCPNSDLVQVTFRRNFCWSTRAQLNKSPCRRLPFHESVYSTETHSSVPGDLAIMKRSAKKDELFSTSKNDSPSISLSISRIQMKYITLPIRHLSFQNTPSSSLALQLRSRLSHPEHD
jgi:hypothetical protein